MGDIETLCECDATKRVKIGDIQLGLKNLDDSWPNPNSITWSQEFEVVIDKTPGQKFLTQCISLDALWRCSMTLNSLTETERDAIRDLDAGPRMIETALHSVCMYLIKKEISQAGGTKDRYQTVRLEFLEAND